MGGILLCSGRSLEETADLYSMMEDPSGDVMVRSGLLAPDVPGMGCSFCLVPKCSGTARTMRSKTELCSSLAIPKLRVQ